MDNKGNMLIRTPQKTIRFMSTSTVKARAYASNNWLKELQ